MLIATHSERITRNSEKIKRLLNFLKEETYSDFKTLMLLFGFRDHKSLYTLLTKTERMGLIQKYVFESRTMKMSLWGITSDGLAVVLTPEDNIFPARFEPSKITGWTLEHHLDNQVARLILEKKGASGWINGDRSTFLSQYQVKHRPDGLITLPDGQVIAVETERRLKTKARYQSIIASHLLARTQKHWIYVFYIVPDLQKKRALELLFSSIKHVIINHQHIPLEARHRNVFRIYTLDELRQLELRQYS
ncbi:molybdopterin-guanine dinucleotide biosynthesis protein MobC [Pectobacterium versatile]|uniref:MobC family replication-relaxation protein n=1 Tax=Pectobacterium TaxID=122277 RepID=UPI000C1BAA3B|nr:MULTISPECIES: MobC family replication-relaxation protein [Pectobacterium]ATV43324.1 molybdopterin-guanine dinucleotide biosynthesis protein MobC [Pectobacterium brasiliense]MBA0182545.1 molybdopterin-guanine dinucleotide biosynthesis protein MobC [Pectobacterium versatile]MCA6982180.1 molybdopterin-guanine dinucleotide biosynthesis protein MobC [Pectobacterium brasiliense]MCH4991736.1 molybdopterin-guanine dinucleotide biosynthesis protein MobC [Pectobacterium brasiliense]RRO01936.1 molybdo